MARTPIFNNRRMTNLLEKYSKHPHSRKLRDKIMTGVYPLVDAAISRKRLFRFREDLRQECALKVLMALPKYRRNRGTAFGFLWATICNSCITHGKRLAKSDLSIDSEENARREAEISQPAKFLSPDVDFLRKLLAKALGQNRNGSDSLRAFSREKEKIAVSFLTFSALNGDLFSERPKVLRQLKRLGIKKKDHQFFLDYVLVDLRSRFYRLRGLANELASSGQAGQSISKVSDS